MRRFTGRRPARSWSVFFLDDADRELIEGKRRSHNRLGFAVLLTTARYLGVFLDDPTDGPAEVVDYLAEQLDIGDASVLMAYGERENTRLEHVRELRRVLEYKEFAEAEADLRTWADARAWTTGEGPKALFDAAVGQLRAPRAAARRDDADPAGGLGAGSGEPAAVGHPVRDVEHRPACGAGLPVDRAARRAGIRAGPVGARPGAGVRTADEVGPGPGRGDRRPGHGRAGCVGDTAAAPGGVVAVRGGRQGIAPEAARRLAPAGDAAGHCGLPGSRRSCGTTSTCSAGIPSTSRTCPAACGPYATRTPPTRRDSESWGGMTGGPLPDYRCSA